MDMEKAEKLVFVGVMSLIAEEKFEPENGPDARADFLEAARDGDVVGIPNSLSRDEREELARFLWDSATEEHILKEATEV